MRLPKSTRLGVSALLVSASAAWASGPTTVPGSASWLAYHRKAAVQAVGEPAAPASSRRFPTGLARASDGAIWLGTEDAGVQRYDPASHVWTCFTTKDGIGEDSITAVACDSAGRVWVGHLAHGVSVYNGESWQNYDFPDGPAGERVFAIATSPVDGSVWIATNGGLSRYQPTTGSWQTFDRSSGLPADEANAVASDARGNLYVGMQCDGVAIASPQDDYRSWTLVGGPAVPPVEPTGAGLPSPLVNAVAAGPAGAVYVGTTCGIAASRDAGRTWRFVRGQDYADKVRLRTGGPPRGWRGPSPHAPNRLLAEDYVTCLAIDGAGRLVVGHRQRGVEVRAAGSLDPAVPSAAGKADDYTTAVLPLSGSAVLHADYRVGLVPAELTAAAVPPGPAGPRRVVPPLPAFARPLTAAEVDRLADVAIRHPGAPMPGHPFAIALPDDWHTRGDWVGRYGNYWTLLCATLSPTAFEWGSGTAPPVVNVEIGRCGPDDSLRYWVSKNYTSNPKALELPPVFTDCRVQQGLTTPGRNRRLSEWDDHGEAYPQPRDGPGIYCTLNIPPGLYVLSFYDYNNDASKGRNFCRDFVLSVRSHPAGIPLDDTGAFDRWPELAHGRIVDFAGGVYKRFLVAGSQVLTFRLDRNYSSNTMLNAIFLDGLEDPEFAASAFAGPPQVKGAHAWINRARLAPPATEAGLISSTIRRLRRWETSDPRRFAVCGRQLELDCLRELLDRPGAGQSSVDARPELAGFAARFLCDFPGMEHLLRLESVETDRAVQQSLRWDGERLINGRGRDWLTWGRYQGPPPVMCVGPEGD